jgi:hypothetical protein
MNTPRKFRNSPIATALCVAAFTWAALGAPGATAGEVPPELERASITMPAGTAEVANPGAAPFDASAGMPLGPQFGPLTREQVKAELAAARAAGTLRPDGEIGDTPEVLAARDAWNAEQARRADELHAALASPADADAALPAAAQAEIRSMLEQAAAEGDEVVFVIVFDADDPDSVAAAEALNEQVQAEARRSGARIGPAVDVLVEQDPGRGVDDV